MTRLPQPSYADFKLEFGHKVQTNYHPDKTNKMNTRTTPTIAPRSSGSQNGWYFMSLKSGKRILRYKWSILPIPASMIYKFHEFVDTFQLKKKNINVPITLNAEDEDDLKDIENQSEQDLKSDFSTSYNKRSSDIKLKENEGVGPERPVGQLIHNENSNYACFKYIPKELSTLEEVEE